MAFAISTAAREAAQSDGQYVALGLDNGCAVFKGDLMVIAVTDIAATTFGGCGYPGAPVTNADFITTACAAGDQFAGVAIESVEATSKYTLAAGFLPGENCVRVATEGEFEFDCSSFNLSSVGAIAYSGIAANPHTVVSSAGTHAVAVGIITWVNSAGTKCRVKINNYAMGAAGIAG